MPYKSLAQQAYFHANKDKLEKQGVDVEEWDQASKGAHLPQRAPKPDEGHSHLKSAMEKAK